MNKKLIKLKLHKLSDTELDNLLDLFGESQVNIFLMGFNKELKINKILETYYTQIYNHEIGLEVRKKNLLEQIVYLFHPRI